LSFVLVPLLMKCLLAVRQALNCKGTEYAMLNALQTDRKGQDKTGC